MKYKCAVTCWQFVILFKLNCFPHAVLKYGSFMINQLGVPVCYTWPLRFLMILNLKRRVKPARLLGFAFWSVCNEACRKIGVPIEIVAPQLLPLLFGFRRDLQTGTNAATNTNQRPCCSRWTATCGSHIVSLRIES